MRKNPETAANKLRPGAEQKGGLCPDVCTCYPDGGALPEKTERIFKFLRDARLYCLRRQKAGFKQRGRTAECGLTVL